MLSKLLRDHEALCVSLSGGVDSMVLLHQLVTCKVERGYMCDVRAVHINYNNRDTCESEVQFVESFCNLLGVNLSVRHITEAVRARDKSRQDYEELTRCIRFQEYAKQKCPVLLGHNYEDTVENVIANISSRKNYHNLQGMTERTIEQGVTIIRPLLSLHKADIYKYADRHGVPHLPDSTPKWSRRGKLRDHVIPALASYEPNFIKGLLQIAQCLCENQRYIQQHPESVKLPSNFVNCKNALYCISNKTVDDYTRRAT